MRKLFFFLNKMPYMFPTSLLFQMSFFPLCRSKGKIGGRRRRGRQRRRWVDGITVSMDMSLSKLRELVVDRKPGVLQSMGLQRVNMAE